MFHIDVARAYGQRRNDAAAVATVLEAERIAPEELHDHLVVPELLWKLLKRARRTATPGYARSPSGSGSCSSSFLPEPGRQAVRGADRARSRLWEPSLACRPGCQRQLSCLDSGLCGCAGSALEGMSARGGQHHPWG
jgi:hypothetical protein